MNLRFRAFDNNSYGILVQLRRLTIMLMVMAGFCVAQTSVHGQAGGAGGAAGGAGTAGTAGTAGNAGNITPGSGGIEIDPNGVLKARRLYDGTGRLDAQRAEAARAALNKDLQQPSKLRKISLNRLEREIAKLVNDRQPIADEMKYLAGLTRITHVFFYPETNDIVIAGPAEGFYVNGQDQVVGLKTGRPVLQLEDLIVALRAFGPDGNKTRVISCSIDPTQQGLLQMKQAYAEVQRQFSPGQELQVVEYFRHALGMQVVTINGVSPKTHFARVMVEADYRMKLIGIGLERPPVRITSFIEKAKPTSVAKNSLQRWYFQPNYDCVAISDDETAMELIGTGVQLVGEDERVNVDGQRTRTGGANRASQNFCNSFTKMYDALSEQVPLYAQLRNLVDMSIVAAFIQEMDLYGQADWNMSTLGSEAKLPVEVLEAPTQVPPAVNAVWKGNIFMTPIGGGVNIQPGIALSADRVSHDESGTIIQTKKSVNFSNLVESQWWWD